MSDDEGGGLAGIIGFIIILGLVNLLSYLFNWGLFVY